MQKIKPIESLSRLEPSIQSAIRAIPDSHHYLIALSGGLDSVALSYFCLPFLRQKTNNIQVIHVNHGLSQQASSWAEFCQTFCCSLGIECIVEEVSVLKDSEGLEASARKARYGVFSRYMKKDSVLLQGHHLNDQAETLMMRFFKGLGPESLKGIPQHRAFNGGFVFRPWLKNITRVLLAQEARQFGLAWVDDESNLNDRFERNYLRHTVLPLLEKRHPSIAKDIAKSSSKFTEASEFIKEWCQSQQATFMSDCYAELSALDIDALKTYTKSQQSYILRYWFDLLGVHHPSSNNFQRIFDDLLTLQPDTKAEIRWKSFVLKSFNGSLFCLSENTVATGVFDGVCLLPDKPGSITQLDMSYGCLSVVSLDANAVDAKLGKLEHKAFKTKSSYEVYCTLPETVLKVAVRSRKGGEKIYLQSEYASSIKKLYQSNKVIPWLRDKLPIIALEDRLVCSMAGFTAKEFKLDSKDNLLNISRMNYFCLRFEFY